MEAKVLALKNSNFIQEMSLSGLLKLAAGSFIGCVLIYAGKIWHAYKFFDKMNIKTPKYTFIYGNLSEIMKNVQF